MKKLISIVVIGILSLSVNAQEYGRKQSDNKVTSYCAILKDGKMMLTSDGKEIYTDVKFPNGATVKSDCTVELGDKTKIILKNGDCVDQDGNIVSAEKKRIEKSKVKEEYKEKNMDYNKKTKEQM